MSDTLNALGALRGASVLDSIAHPSVANPLAAIAASNEAAEQGWRIRQAQAQQAAGQVMQAAIDPQTGQLDQAKLMQGLANTPGASLAAQETAKQGLAYSGEQYSQHITHMAHALAQGQALIAENGGVAPLDAVQKMFADNVQNGWLRQDEADAALQGFGPDARQNAALLKARGLQNLTMQQTLDEVYGKQIDYTDPSGRRMGATQTSPMYGGSGIYSPQQQGAMQGPSPEARAQIITVTGPHGTEQDTLDGFLKKGVFTAPGQLAPGYQIASGSPAMVEMLRGTEATPDGRTSVSGARGQLQVTPDTFKRYAQPGESFDSKADVETVGRRVIGQLEAQFPNDPGRVATAYFSGPDNVAPPGSPTPWKVDKVDPNGAKTSDYVNRAIGRYKTAQGPTAAQGGQQPGPGGVQSGGGVVTPAGTQEQNKIDQEQYNKQSIAYNNNDANLIANIREAYSLGQKLASGKGLQNLADARSTLVSLGRQFGIDTGRMDTLDQIRAEEDKVLNQILLSYPGAGRSDASLATTAGATPHLGMNTNAMLNQLRIMYGQIKQQNAAMLLHDPNTNGIGYSNNNRAMMNTTSRDGFAADIMTPDQIDAQIARLNAGMPKGKDSQAAKAFKKAVEQNMAAYQHGPASNVEW